MGERGFLTDKQKFFSFFAVLLLALLITGTGLVAVAATNIEIDDDEYNLFVDEYPDGVNEGIYAKTKSKKSDIDDYYLNFSSDESQEKFESAISKSGINMKGKLSCSMDAALYKIGDEEDKKVSDATIVLMPVPDDAQEHPQDATFYQVSGGKLKEVSTELVVCDDVYYNKFNLSSYGTYGYVYNDPETYEEDDSEENKPTSTPSPTKKPAATPTPTPKVTDNKKPTATPTAAPKPTSSGTSGKADSSSKDYVPKTGDDFSYLRYILLGAGALGVLITVVIKLRK